MKHIVSFSTGLSSAITGERVQQKFDNVEIVFCDTRMEHPDNYRFLEDIQERWLKVYGNDVTILREGRDPYQVSSDASIIPNQKIAPCTFRLKIEPFAKYIEDLKPATIYIGYDYTEVHRIEATEKNWNEKGFEVGFPLLWKPYELRPYTQVSRDDWDIEPPEMYALGYTHANCGGRCVKQGKGDWMRTLINYPELYRQAEEWEGKMRDHPIRKDYALLRDQSNGKVRAMTLFELRQRHEQGLLQQPTYLDFNSGCVHCGVSETAGVAG